ncbi:MAG: hypothetical protein BWY83_01231 [bacterium ADurb.Bin478]|nr:MAG: hypothetical protein BWY83_01231 [bacterium ADurb.Bin478]
MKKNGWLLILLPGLLCAQVKTENPYYQMTVAEIDQDIRRVSVALAEPAQRMAYYSERFLDAPYELVCEGEGENGRYETQPLLNLRQVNCMTYCEIVLALSLSDYYEEFFNVLQHIRYRQGIISMATRNHYTMVDWLPANKWCLEDVTKKVGAKDVRWSTRTISHKNFFAGKSITDIPVLMPDRTATIAYLPLDQVEKHAKALQDGDIVSLIQNQPGIFSAHMLLIIKKEGKPYFRHAGLSAKKVLDQPLGDYIAALSRNPRFVGMSFMRVKEKIDWVDGSYTHGKFLVKTK